MSGTTEEERNQMAQEMFGKNFDECDSMERIRVGGKLGGSRIHDMAAERRGEDPATSQNYAVNTSETTTSKNMPGKQKESSDE